MKSIMVQPWSAVRGILLIVILLTYASDDLYAQGLRNDAAKIVITSNTHVKVNGNINNQNGVFTNEGSIQLTEDFVQSGGGANYLGNGWLNFQGTANQSISGLTSLSKLNINNGNKLLISNDLRITDSLDLSNNGKLELGTYDLLLISGVELINFDTDNYIITNSSGSLKRYVDIGEGVLEFPVGNASYNMAKVQNTGTADTFSIRVDDLVLSEGTSGTAITQEVVNRTWFIDEETNGGSNVTLDLQWNTSEQLTGFSQLDCGISHYDGTEWDVPMTSAATLVSGSYYSQSRSGLSSFSPFAVGGSGTLPVELLFFYAERKDKETVLLSWQTATETNNSGFEVQRSLDGINFDFIAWVDGAGSTSEIQDYRLEDFNNYRELSYYRLKQIDFDGHFSYSPIRVVHGSNMDSEPKMTLYPNPASDFSYLQFENFEDSEYTLKIYSLSGQLIHEQDLIVPSGINSFSLPVDKLEAGSYFINLFNEKGDLITVKLFKL